MDSFCTYYIYFLTKIVFFFLNGTIYGNYIGFDPDIHKMRSEMAAFSFEFHTLSLREIEESLYKIIKIIFRYVRKFF